MESFLVSEKAGPRPEQCFVIVFVLPETGSRPHPISEITGDTEKAVTEGSRWEADTGMRKQYYYLHWDGDVTSSDPEFYTGNLIY